MKRRLLAGLLCLLLVTALPLTGYADSLPMVLDFAGILSSSEVSKLERMSAELQAEYQMDAVILTVPSLDGKTAMEYAEDYYDENGYGTDDERSGTLFLLAMEERDWYIDTSGNAVFALTDYALLEMEELVLPYLQDGAYYDAFAAWLDALDGYFAAYENGVPVDGYVPEEDEYEGHEETVYYEYDDDDYRGDFRKAKSPVNWLISVAVGLTAAGVVIAVMYAGMNTKRRQNSAEEYLKEGSYQLRVRRDIFLYSQVSKTRRDTDSGSSGGGSRSRGGGSSVHRSSSGRSHGGRGGKF